MVEGTRENGGLQVNAPLHPSHLEDLKGRCNMDKQTILDKLDIENFYKKEIPSMRWNKADWGQGFCFKHEDKKPSLFANKKTGQLHCK